MKVLFVYGTRPEAIKMAPLVKAMKQSSDFIPVVCVTGQHREMLDQVNEFFTIKPDYDLNVMTDNQSLFEVTNKILSGLEPILEDEKPDYVLVQGDTASTFVGALSGYYSKTSVLHIEAGLRTGDLFSPFPEEGNRLLTSRLAKLHFAPTESNKNNLIKENISPKSVFVTGNTGVDALFMALEILDERKEVVNQEIEPYFKKPVILLTAHRRESFGDCFKDICKAILKISSEYADWNIVYPLHPNPNVQKVVKTELGSQGNIHLLQPLDYPSFVYAMKRSEIIVTDSGGIQEEAPSLGKPVLVIRDKTERQEALVAKTVKLIGTKTEKIYNELKALIDSESLRVEMSKAQNPYGDGKACDKILNAIRKSIKEQ